MCRHFFRPAGLYLMILPLSKIEFCLLVFATSISQLSFPALADSDGDQKSCADRMTPRCLAMLALADAASLEVNYWRNLAHVAIASAELEFGDIEGARANLLRAHEQVSSEVNAFNRVEVLIEISVVQAELGAVKAAEHSIARALSTANVITLPDWRYWALSFVPRAKAKTCAVIAAKKSIQQSLISVKLIRDIVARASASTHIASAQVEVGDPEGAIRTIGRILQVVSRIDDEFWKTELLTQVALLQGRVGDMAAADDSIAKALAMVQQINGSWRNWRLAQIALVQAQIGEGLVSRGRIQDLVKVLKRDLADDRLAGWRTFAFANLSKALAIIETREAGGVPAFLLAARLCA